MWVNRAYQPTAYASQDVLYRNLERAKQALTPVAGVNETKTPLLNFFLYPKETE